uniref:Gypsy retrotransposon integrase-like protein 1 n=1 Tax=Podarcis muralis TaxID=64176 RepID=A0A670ILS5_PODMU
MYVCVRGSETEAQVRGETESDEEESQDSEEEDDNDLRSSMSLSSESEDSQEGAPLVRTRGVTGGTCQEQGSSRETPSGSGRSGPASQQERSEERGVPSVTHGAEQERDRGRRSGQDVLPEEAESSTGSSVSAASDSKSPLLSTQNFFLQSSRSLAAMSMEQQIAELRNAVSQLTTEVVVSQKKGEEAEKRCQDLQARWDHACQVGFPGAKAAGVALGRRGGNLVAHFDGNLQQYPSFRADVEYALHLLRDDFKDEEEKVGFIVSHLHGEARAWLRNLWREDCPARRDSDEFIKCMDACFQSSVDVDVARQQIHGLRQGKASVRQYHARFFALLNVLRWEKDSLAVRDLFWEGLSGPVKDELARGDRPKTLADVVQRCLLCFPEIQDVRVPHLSCRQGRSRWNWGVQRLSQLPEPQRPEQSRQSLLEGTGSVTSVTVRLPITIDSGSNADFVGVQFVKQHRIELLPATLPLNVVTVDGRKLLGGQVVQQTPPMVMQIGNHREVISFNVTRLSDTPIVLGMSWLDRHSPTMAWYQRQLTFGSSYCAQHCIQTGQEEEGQEEGQQLRLSMAQAVPLKYKGFLEVLCETEADQLPPHRPYDCLYSMSEDEMQELREFIDHNLQRGFIRESKAAGGSPVFFVKKRDTPQKRLIVDYRFINSKTKPAAFPMPKIDDLLGTVRRGKIFTKLDLRGAYNLIRVREGDEWKTAMFTPLGTYEYRVMPFGLQNGSHFFQAFMHHVLAGLLYKKCVCFLDDILIFSESPEAHESDVKEVLQRLREHRLYAKLEKCQFDVTEVDFLGYRLSDRGLAMDSAKVRAVLDWKSPRTRKEVQRFVGFANFYRKFIRGFARETAAITDTLSSKKKKFTWTDQAEQSFRRLKSLFASEEQLLHVNPGRPMRVETDASDRAVGAVLLQEDPQGNWRPCAFYSRKLSKSEQNYTLWDRELLAIHAAFKAWRHFLIGAKHTVQVRTDHKNLEYWRTAKLQSQRHIRWAELFADFDFRIEYIPGDNNVIADALSRKPQYLEEAAPAAARHIFAPQAWACTSAAVDLEAVRRALQADPFAQSKMEEVRRGTAKDDEFQIRDGLLTRKGALYVPGDDLRAKVLQQLHDAPSAGHFGKEKTTELVARDFWWPQMRGEVAEYVARCDTCQRSKPVHQKPAGLLEPLETPLQPWERVALDFVTDLPSSRGKTAVLVVVDLFTKMAHFIPCAKVATAEQTAKLFIDHVFKVHGLPRSILSDRGRQFVSSFWQKLLGILHVKISLSLARHPQTNGQAERVNAIMQQRGAARLGSWRWSFVS